MPIRSQFRGTKKQMRLTIVPARSGSARIKDKNVIDFCGKPMIAYPLEAARESGLFDTIHVSTDSERYAQIVRDLGFEVAFLRGAALADNRVGMVDILRWVVREYEKRGQAFDDICMIYATAALIEAEDLRRGYAKFVRHGRTIPLLAVTTYSAPVQRSLRIGDASILQPYFPESWPRHSQDLAPAYHDAGAFFFVSAERLMADTVKIYHEFLPLVLPRHKAVDIDEQEDMEIAKNQFLGRESKNTDTDKQPAHRA